MDVVVANGARPGSLKLRNPAAMPFLAY